MATAANTITTTAITTATTRQGTLGEFTRPPYESVPIVMAERSASSVWTDSRGQPSSVTNRSISASAAAIDAAPSGAKVSSASTGYTVICIELPNN